MRGLKEAPGKRRSGCSAAERAEGGGELKGG